MWKLIWPLGEAPLPYSHLEQRGPGGNPLTNSSPITWDFKLELKQSRGCLFRHSRCLKLKVFVGGPPLFGVTINKCMERRSNRRCRQASVSSALIGKSFAFVAQAESIRSWAQRPRQGWPALPPARPWQGSRTAELSPLLSFLLFSRIPPTCQALFTPFIQSLPFFQGPAPPKCHWRTFCLPWRHGPSLHPLPPLLQAQGQAFNVHLI